LSAALPLEAFHAILDKVYRIAAIAVLLAACTAGNPGPAPTPGLACPRLGLAPQKSSALVTAWSTYLGKGSSDAANAVDLAPDCSLLIGGSFSGSDFGKTPTVFLGGSSGAVLRLEPTGAVRAVARLGSAVADLEARVSLRESSEARRDSGTVAVAGDFGLAVLAPDLESLLWSVGDQGAASRVAIGSDGTVAALFGKAVRIYGATGKLLGTLTLSDSAVNDVAVDGRGQRVFVTGFAQRDGGPCSQLQVAWVRAYSYAGSPLWKAYDWTHAQAAAANSSCADTRGVRLALGRDGWLYFAGESAGGNSIFRFSPQDLASPAPNVKSDKYTDPYNTASNPITYLARLDPASGANLAGQFLLARLDSGKGNTLRPRALAADEAGRVYIGGVSAYAIASRASLTLDGEVLPPYAGDDAWVLVASPDLKERLLWMVWNAGGKGEVRGLAAGGGIAALAARVNAAPLHLNNALQPDAPSGGGPGFASAWPGWPP